MLPMRLVVSLSRRLRLAMPRRRVMCSRRLLNLRHRLGRGRRCRWGIGFGLVGTGVICSVGGFLSELDGLASVSHVLFLFFFIFGAFGRWFLDILLGPAVWGCALTGRWTVA